MTATADYGVSIAEDFAPPENWIPGQEINKDVGLVNTGNVDAFTRVWLEGEMKVIARDATGAASTMTSGAGSWDSSATDKLNSAQLVTTTTLDSYLRVLNKDKGSADYSEVQSMQAGAWLAYAPASCEWTYTETAASTNPAVVSADTVVTAGSGTSTSTATFVTAGTYGCAIDAATFKPKTSGLYLFRRNADVNTLDSDKNVYYSGYYYDAGSTTGYGTGTYYALNTETDGTGKTVVYAAHTDVAGTKIYTHSDQSTGITIGGTTDKLVTADVANVKLFLAKRSVIENTGLTWTYDDSTAGSEKFSVSPTTGTVGDGIDITIKLANIGDGTVADKWQAIKKGTAATTFYYTEDLEEGATTSKLVDSVTMNDTVTADDYVAFDFDLNVKMDSIQITTDSSGKETFETVSANNSWASTDGASAAHLVASDKVTYSGNELSILKWTVDT